MDDYTSNKSHNKVKKKKLDDPGNYYLLSITN